MNEQNHGKVRLLYSEQVETDLCAACHDFAFHVHACRRLNRLCILADVVFSSFLSSGAILGKNCLVKRATHL